ncbi:Rho-GAP domain-containing protein [Plasmodiophora brassicae]
MAAAKAPVVVVLYFALLTGFCLSVVLSVDGHDEATPGDSRYQAQSRPLRGRARAAPPLRSVPEATCLVSSPIHYTRSKSASWPANDEHLTSAGGSKTGRMWPGMKRRAGALPGPSRVSIQRWLDKEECPPEAPSSRRSYPASFFKRVMSVFKAPKMQGVPAPNPNPPVSLVIPDPTPVRPVPHVHKCGPVPPVRKSSLPSPLPMLHPMRLERDDARSEAPGSQYVGPQTDQRNANHHRSTATAHVNQDMLEQALSTTDPQMNGGRAVKPNHQHRRAVNPGECAHRRRRDPFVRGVPHSVRVLINTIYCDASLIPPAALRDLFRQSLALTEIDADLEFAKLASVPEMLPDASKAQTKRKAVFLLARWLANAASKGCPLLPNCVAWNASIRSTTHPSYSFWESISDLDHGRFLTLMSLRRLCRRVITLQRDAPLRDPLTFDELAAGLAPLIVAKLCREQMRGTVYTQLFLPKFARWLTTYSE